MKTTLFKKMFTVLMAIVLTVSFCPTGAFSFTVSAEGLASHVTINGVHYYVVAPAVNGTQPNVTIDLGDGAKTYNTQTFTSAYTAAGGATGQTSVIALTEGYYSVTEPASAGTAAKVSIIGYGTSADKIIVDATTWFRAQFPMYLNNFTLHTGEAQSFVGASWLECGPTFRSTGWTLWAPWAYQANAYTGTDHKAVIDGTLVYGKYFAAFGAGDFVKQTTLGGQGHLYEVTINNLMMGDYVYTDCGRILLGNYRASLTYTGNYIFTLNNATPHDTTPYVDVSKAAGAVTTFNGTATLILNNGMASKWTVTDEAKAAVDYCVIVPENGYVTVTEETKKATVPTFEIAAPEGKTPIIDGKEIELVGGKYLYTPATTGTVNVFFVGEECDHTYNNDCDTDCNVCGDVREVGDHVYDHVCDPDCNECGMIREVSGHVYNDNCDAVCNTCGEVRQTGVHIYSSVYDANCIICGDLRMDSHVTINGVHYYVVAPAVNGVQPSVTIDLGDGAKTYNTQTFTSAYTAAGGATGQTSVIALTEGYYSVTEPASAGTAAKVSIIGYGTSADKIIVDATTWFRAQFPMYLNNFTLHTGEAQSFVGASWLECGPTFRSTGWTLWAPWAYQANAYTGTDHKAVIDGTLVYGKYFAAFGAGDFVKQTTLGGQGHLYEVTINNLMMGDYVYTDCGRILLGNYRASLTYTGNYIFTLNNATPHDTTPYVDVSKAAGAVTTFNGTATLILNNGMASKWTVTDEAKAAVDYCVIVPENGYVTVTEETKKATVPTFEIAAPEGKTPIIDGKEIELVGGKYLYTPTTTGTIKVFFVSDQDCDHTYDNDCDTDCNVCGDAREVDGHVYDNDYDADCNVCGDVREVPEKPIVPSDAPHFVVDNATAKVGDTFTVTVRTENNTGIVALRLNIAYDADLLELVSITGQDFAGTTFGPITNNPITVSWVDALNPNNQTNGVIATLTFRVKEDAPEGATAITVTYPPDDVYDYDFENVTFGTVDGTIDIINYISGDVNDDGIVNNKDIGLMQRYLNGWGNEIDERAADVTGDGNINNKDIGILQRYINGWEIELQS